LVDAYAAGLLGDEQPVRPVTGVLDRRWPDEAAGYELEINLRPFERGRFVGGLSGGWNRGGEEEKKRRKQRDKTAEPMQWTSLPIEQAPAIRSHESVAGTSRPVSLSEY
jgi:hypothetical protein